MSEIDNAVESAEVAPLKVPETRLLVIPGGRPDLDADARMIAERSAAANRPTRLQINLGLFQPGSKRQYKHWRGVNWKMEFASFAEVVEFREAMGEAISQWFDARK